MANQISNAGDHTFDWLKDLLNSYNAADAARKAQRDQWDQDIKNTLKTYDDADAARKAQRVQWDQNLQNTLKTYADADAARKAERAKWDAQLPYQPILTGIDSAEMPTTPTIPTGVPSGSVELPGAMSIDSWKAWSVTAPGQSGQAGTQSTSPAPTTQTQATLPSFFTQPMAQQAQLNQNQMLQSPFADKKATGNPLYWANTSFAKH